MTLVGYIRRYIGVLGFMRVAGKIILLDLKTTYCAEKLINAHKVKVLMPTDYQCDERLKIASTNSIRIDHSFPVLILSKNIWLLRNSLKVSVRCIFIKSFNVKSNYCCKIRRQSVCLD